MRKKISLLAACLAGGVLGTVGACGDDGGGNPDARHFDANTTPDAPGIDAAGVNYTGTLSILESDVVVPNGSGGFASFGQGPAFRFAFLDATQTGTPVLEEMQGSPFGCKVWEYTPAQYAANLGSDLGSFAVTFTGGVTVPTCSFTGAPNGYACPDLTTASAGDNAIVGPGPQAGLATLTDVDVTYNAGNVTGRYIKISGATSAGNNGAFPIVALAGANTIVYANPAAVTETLGGSHLTVAGAGPIPQVPDPGFIADDATLQVDFTTTDQAAFGNFTGTLDDFGDDFDLDAASKGFLTGVPLDGTAFTLDCGANCGNSLSSVLNIQTTDTPVTGLSPFALPPPTTKSVLVRCASTPGLGNSVTVPAEYSAYLMGAGATRAQATFVRGSTASTPGFSLGKLVVVGGHAQVGFTTVPVAAQ